MLARVKIIRITTARSLCELILGPFFKTQVFKWNTTKVATKGVETQAGEEKEAGEAMVEEEGRAEEEDPILEPRTKDEDTGGGDLGEMTMRE